MTGIDVPISRLVADDIRRRLDAGAWHPGTRMPTEDELSAEYPFARATIRRAMRLLSSDGVIEVRASGTYVPRRPEVRDVPAPLGGRVAVRMPTAAEFASLEIPEDVPVLVVTDAGGRVTVYPGDATELTIPLPRRYPLSICDTDPVALE